MTDAVAVVLMVGIVAYAVFGGADFGAGFWDLTAGGAERGERPRAVIAHSIGPVWEANHVWLIFIAGRALDRLPRGVRIDHHDAVRAALPRRARHRAPRRELRLPQRGRPHLLATQLRRRVRNLVGPGALLHGRRRRRDRVRARPRRRESRRPVVELDQPHLDPRRRPRRHRLRLPRRGLHDLGRAAASPVPT